MEVYDVLNELPYGALLRYMSYSSAVELILTNFPKAKGQRLQFEVGSAKAVDFGSAPKRDLAPAPSFPREK